MLSEKLQLIIESPIKIKLVFNGEALATTRSSPTLSCHHGTNKETITKAKSEILPANPNQLIFKSILSPHSTKQLAIKQLILQELQY